MSIFEVITLARALLLLGKELAYFAIEIAKLVQAGGTPDEVAEAARAKATQQAAGRAAYEASKHAKGAR